MNLTSVRSNNDFRKAMYPGCLHFETAASVMTRRVVRHPIGKRVDSVIGAVKFRAVNLFQYRM